MPLRPGWTLLLLVGAAGAAPLRDGDFERPDLTFGTVGEPGDWSVSIHGKSDATVRFVDGAGRGGSRCVAYHKSAEGNQNIHLDQVLTLQPETIYEVTAQVKGDGRLEPLLAVLDLNWRVLQLVSCGRSGDWAEVKLWFNSYDLEHVRLEWFPGASGKLYTAVAGRSFIDDVAVRPVPNPSQELVQAFAASRPQPDHELDLTQVRTGPIGNPLPLRRIVCRDGVLRYEDGSEVALFGLNIQTALSWEYRSRLQPLNIPLEAATLNRLFDENLEHFDTLGTGVIRAHLLPSDFSDGEGNLRESVYLDALDHMLAKCSDRGIYVYLTLLNEMNTPDDGSFVKGHERDTWLFDDAFVKHAETYVKALLSHPNRYSGRALKDEPSLGLIELQNEPAYLDYAAVQQDSNQPYRRVFEQWLAGRDAPDVLFQAYRYGVVRRWIDRLCGAVRSTGAAQPILYNLNWSRFIGSKEDVFQAVADSQVDGVSFCLYPGQGSVPSPYWAHPAELSGENFLPYLRTAGSDYGYLRWVLGQRFSHKAKCVYEFETMYNQSGYLYPAMARLFRSLGVQVAQMWEYTLSPVAEHHGGSHYLNLYCTPRKAAAFRVASEVFRHTPRYQPLQVTDDTTILEPHFAASYEHDVSVIAEPDVLAYTGSLAWQPIPLPEHPQRIVGTGSSKLVSYDGSGVYDVKVGDETIEIQIYPDVERVREAWQRPLKDRPVTVKLLPEAEHRFTLRLSDWDGSCRVERLDPAGEVTNAATGISFIATAGRYRVTRR